KIVWRRRRSALWDRPEPDSTPAGGSLSRAPSPGACPPTIATREPLLVFVDESGKPHPNDPSTHSILCAVCVPERLSRTLNQALYDVVKEVYPDGEPFAKEIKAEKYVARKPYEYSAERRQLVERVAELVEGTPLWFFSVQMKRPAAMPNWQKSTLTPSFRLLTERIELLMRENESDGFAK